jgi:hypothetical protein
MTTSNKSESGTADHGSQDMTMPELAREATRRGVEASVVLAEAMETTA